MAVIAVRCPFCDSDNIVKRGKINNGKQRYLCQREACSQRTLVLVQIADRRRVKRA
jgi:transposase-like protein